MDMLSDVNLEITILGELIFESMHNRANALTILRDYDFTDKTSLEVFKCIKKLSDNHRNIDEIILQSITHVDNNYILKLMQIASTANLSEHIRQLRNITLKRKFLSGLSQISIKINDSNNPAAEIEKFSADLVRLSRFSYENLHLSAKNIMDDIASFNSEPPEKRYSFGVKFMDDAMGGYHHSDVVIIASKTGKGKTELATIIAETAAKNGAKILFLSLESELHEIGARIYFKNLCEKYFNDNPGMIYPLSFDRFMSKNLMMLDKYHDIVNAEIEKYAKNITVQYRHNEFTIDDLNNQFKRSCDYDVIIIDHVHYIDILEDSEIQGLKKIIKSIRTNNLIYNKPIIVVAHLRKTNKRDDEIVPDIEDLHGTSNLAKIATKTVMFAPDFTEDHDNLYRTFFRIAKCRRNSSALKYVANLKFDARYNNYQDRYKLGRYHPYIKEFVECTKFPYWYPEYYKYS